MLDKIRQWLKRDKGCADVTAGTLGERMRLQADEEQRKLRGMDLSEDVIVHAVIQAIEAAAQRGEYLVAIGNNIGPRERRAIFERPDLLKRLTANLLSEGIRTTHFKFGDWDTLHFEWSKEERNEEERTEA